MDQLDQLCTLLLGKPADESTIFSCKKKICKLCHEQNACHRKWHENSSLKRSDQHPIGENKKRNNRSHPTT
jgi:hypothetical protein